MNNKEDNDKKLWTYHQTSNVDNLLMGHPRQDRIFKKINKLIQVGRILEIGFGDGYLLNKLSKKYKCSGADISSENVNQMQKKIKGVKFSQIDVTGNLPYESNYFDGFIASEVLEHMTDRELDIGINEIKRILKPGGIAIITVPAEENLKDNECFCPNCKIKFHKWGHKQKWGVSSVKERFKEFRIIMIKKVFTVHRGVSILERVAGFGMYAMRNILNKMIDIPGGTYLIIIKKR